MDGPGLVICRVDPCNRWVFRPLRHNQEISDGSAPLIGGLWYCIPVALDLSTNGIV